MAAKQSKGSSYKIPPKEMIVTRNKSARMRQQMLEDNRKTKPKPPTKSLLKKVPKNTTKTKNKKKIVEIAEDNDYYPNLKKRDVIKQMFLKPKDKFKLIGDVTSVNKRKLCIPQKFHTAKADVHRMNPACASSRTVTVSKTECDNEKRTQQPVYSELGMEEVVRFTEDTQSLTEEDLMEILTCPSPVWWEDPPDDSYVEGAIFCRTSPPEPALSRNNNNTKLKEVNQAVIIKNPKNEYKPPLKIINALKKSEVAKSKKLDEQFLKKNTKLENILGCVKERLSSRESKLGVNRRTKKQKVPFECNTVPENRICDEHNKLKLTPRNVNMNDSVTCDNNTERISISTDTDELSDTSLNDTELLKYLENINIPTEEEDLVATSGLTNRLRTTDGEIPDVDVETLIKTSVVKKSCTADNKEISSGVDNNGCFQKYNPETELESSIQNSNNCTSVNTIDAIANEGAISNVSPEKEGTHKKTSKRKRKMKFNCIAVPDGETGNVKRDLINSPNKYPLIFKPFSYSSKKQNNDIETTNCNRNIKTYKARKKPVEEVPKETEKTDKNKEIDTDLEATSTDRAATDPDKKLDENTNKQKEINSFFKKCKNAHKTKSKTNGDPIDENSDYCRSCEPQPKMIIVSHKESVKYCMQCSSVFDGDECYCNKTRAQELDTEQIQEHVAETEFLSQNSVE